MMTYIIGFLYSIYEGFWRRWFGGLFGHTKYEKILNNRFIQHIFGFLGFFGILFYNGLNIWLSILSGLVFQGLYWARSHGCCFDFGHGQPPDIKRYDQLWYWKYVKKIIPESELYGFWCDYILMTVRYTLPAMLFAITSLQPSCMFMGIVLSTIYAFCWKAYDFGYTKSPTATAEVIVGFTTGLMIAL